jgi:hypothetical protein
MARGSSAHHCDCGERIILARGAAIILGSSVTPLKLALNWVPDPQGTIAAHQDAGMAWHARLLGAGEEPRRAEQRFTPHAQTCPLAASAQAEFAARWKQATAARAKARRNQRGRRPQKQITGYRVSASPKEQP